MEEKMDSRVILTDYLRILLRGRWIILLSFLVVLGSVAYYTFTTEPIYQATTKIIIKEDGGMQQALFDISSYRKQETMINNQVEIIKSRSLAEKVITYLQNSEYADRLRILGNVVDRSSRFNLSQMIAGIFGGSDGDNGGNNLVVKRISFDNMVDKLRRKIRVDPIRNTDMVELKVTAPSPFEAAYITNTLAKVYKEQNQLESQEEVRKVKNFLEEQLEIIQKKLMESEQALKNYKEKEKVVALPEETQELVTKLAEFETLYYEALTDLNSTRERLKYIDEQLDKSRENFNIEVYLTSPFLEELKKQMTEIEAEKAKFIAGLINEGVYDENNTKLRQYEERINTLKEKMKKGVTKLASGQTSDPLKLSESLFGRKIELEAEIQSLQPKVDALKQIIDQYNRMLESLPDKSIKLARLERAAKLDEKICMMMKEKYEESRITEVGQLGNVRIIDPARPPKSPIKPNKRLNIILGALVGLGLGIGITFFMEFMDNSVRSVEDIERLGIPILASIPIIKLEEATRKLKREGKLNDKEGSKIEINRIVSRLITHFAPKSPISEAYRSLRTNIQYAKVEKPLRTILITSPGPGEGKSTTVANLAITMAQMGSKVLLMDTDLRRPILHSIFGVDKSKGLSNYLVGRIGLEEIIVQTHIDNLSIIPCGLLPPNPSELLGSTAMKELLEEVKRRFDLILFDSPPVIAVTDAAVLSSIVDGVILVVKSGHTDRDAVQRGYNLLQNVHASVLGALLNVVKIESMYGSYYYYYYHYYYYGKDGVKRKRRKRA